MNASRAKLSQLKADFDECVTAVLADPNFSPEADRSPEESAAAICATKPGEPAAGTGKAEGSGVGGAAPDAATALLAGNIDRLPERGRRIYDSMYRSSLRFLARAQGTDAEKVVEDTTTESYARGIAWRAVAEAYGFDRGQSAEPQAGAPAARTLRVAPAVNVKYAPNQAAGLEGDSVIVPIALNWRGDLARWYDRVSTREIPNSNGVKVVVGHERMKQATTAIYALVPRQVAGSMPAGIGAVDWVRRNIAYVHQIADAEVSTATNTVSVHYAKRTKTDLQVQGKFVSTPDLARKRITLGIVYPAWEVDLQGQYGTSDQVEEMAHGYLARGGAVKLMHQHSQMTDGKAPGQIVQSFIARPGDRDFPEEAWVAATQWHPEVWPDVVAKRLRGYSIGGQWTVTPLHLQEAR